MAAEGNGAEGDETPPCRWRAKTGNNQVLTDGLNDL
jgi:hypothetical protein